MAGVLDRIEGRVVAVVRRAFRAMLRAALSASTGTPDADRIAGAARDGWSGELPQVEDAIATAVADAVADVTGGVRLGGTEAAARDHIATVHNRLVGVPDEVFDTVRATLDAGFEAGDTPDDLRARVAEALRIDEWDSRAARVARTETTGAYGAGAEHAATAAQRVLGEPVQRRWLATADARTRAAHRDADGQTRPVGEPFSVGGEALMFPGDPNGSAENVINCRCAVTYDTGGIDWDDVERRRQAMTAEQTRGRDGTFDGNPRPVDAPLWPKRPGAGRVDRVTWLHQAAQLPDEVLSAASEARVRMVLRLAAALSKDPYLPEAMRSQADGLGARVAGLHPLWAGRVITAEGLPEVEWTRAEADAVAAALGQDDPDVDALVALLPPELLQYWTTGEGAAKIRWGTDGDWTRCHRYLSEYIPGRADGACATLHKLTTGVWPGDRRNADGVSHNAGITDTGTDTVTVSEHGAPCPCDLPAIAAGLAEARTSDRSAGLRGDDGQPDGGMIALVPSDADAQRINLAGGLAPDELHITLLYLGAAEAWDEQARADLHELIARVAGGYAFPARLFGQAVFNPTGDNPALVYIVGDDTGTLDAWHTAVYGAPEAGREVQAMQHSPWVAHLTAAYGDTDTRVLADHADETITIDRLRVAFGDEHVDYPLDAVTVPETDDSTDDDGDPSSIPEQVADAAPALLASADELAGLIAATIPPAALRTEVADMTMPDTEAPDTAAPDATEPADDTGGGWRQIALDHLDQLRALIEQGEADGDNMDEFAETARGLEMVASKHTPLALYAGKGRLVAEASVIADAVANAPQNPPSEWFQQAKLPGLTPMTVNADGRVWGHMAPWGVGHEGIPEEKVEAPRTAIDYAAFHRVEMATGDGQPVKVGHLLAGCDHAPLGMTMAEAAEYHRQSCTQVAAVRAYEDEHGIQVVGSLMPGLSVEQANGITKLSGEWRAVTLEMMAAVGVDRAGYPVAPQDATELATAASGPHVLAASATTGDGAPPAEWVQAVADELAARQAQQARRESSIAAVTAARKGAVVREFDRQTKG